MYILKATNQLGSVFYYKCGISAATFIKRHTVPDELLTWEIVGEYQSLDAMEDAMALLLGNAMDKGVDPECTEIAGYELTEDLMGRKVKQLSQSHKESIAKALRGRTLPEEQKKKIAASLVGKKKLPNHRKNIGAALRKRGTQG
jgi:hypothetical protein